MIIGSVADVVVWETHSMYAPRCDRGTRNANAFRTINVRLVEIGRLSSHRNDGIIIRIDSK